MTDYEITIDLAKKVMKWEITLRFVGEGPGKVVHPLTQEPWEPLRDWNNTMEVVQRMEERDHAWMMNGQLGGHGNVHDVIFRRGNSGGSAADKSLQRAICLAALAAVSSSA